MALKEKKLQNTLIYSLIKSEITLNIYQKIKEWKRFKNEFMKGTPWAKSRVTGNPKHM